ncbi:MAG TPA: hypothetical protein VGY14_01115 [Methyloceanibacter sp.]|nr:hypothetical protein [Methyloceanibacter sp.]
MKLTSIGLMAGMAADTFTTGPSTGIGEPGFQSSGLPPETPQQSTGLAPGTLREQAPVEPNSLGVPADNSVLPQNSTSGTPAPNTGG